VVNHSSYPTRRRSRGSRRRGRRRFGWLVGLNFNPTNQTERNYNQVI
jgi:hypothetical protein